MTGNKKFKLSFQYVFFHIRPLLMVILFPYLILNFSQSISFYPSSYLLPAIVLALLGLVILITAHWAVYKPKQWADKKIIFLKAEPNELVTTGIYSYVRNPMLIGIYCILISASIIFSSIYLLLYFLLVCVASISVSVMVEEKQLEKTFGQEYKQYARKVFRFIPKFI